MENESDDFKQALIYFQQNEKDFDDYQFKFLISIMSYADSISDRQKDVFCRMVSVVKITNDRKKRRE